MNRFGLASRHWELISQLVIAPLHRHNCNVYVFGSRARGDFRPFSDLDLLVEGSVDPLALSEIREDLEESNLPIKVDLVHIDDLAESYRAGILHDRVKL